MLCSAAIRACVLLGSIAAGPALAQHTQPTTGGVRVTLPNVYGFNRSLPMERTVSAPPMRTVSVPALVGSPVIFTTGRRVYVQESGFRLNASYSGDKWSIDARLGSDPVQLIDGRWVTVPGYRYVYPRYPYSRSYDRWYGSYPRYPIDGTLTAPPQIVYVTQQQPAAQPEPLTPMERARVLLRYEQSQEAVAALREHLRDDPEDTGAMRLLGLALIESGDPAQGAAVLALAYRTDPTLAGNTTDLDLFAGRAGRARGMIDRSMHYAARANSASGWLAATVLLHADGRSAAARRVLERAREAGLESEVYDRLSAMVGFPGRG
ncbi:MAG: hypothetical protein KJZ54_03970 [Phycisphaerales bacterium]|nr:hypothetical protein [Phycisphaerales bacterium]